LRPPLNASAIDLHLDIHNTVVEQVLVAGEQDASYLSNYKTYSTNRASILVFRELTITELFLGSGLWILRLRLRMTGDCASGWHMN